MKITRIFRLGSKTAVSSAMLAGVSLAAPVVMTRCNKGDDGEGKKQQTGTKDMLKADGLDAKVIKCLCDEFGIDESAVKLDKDPEITLKLAVSDIVGNANEKIQSKKFVAAVLKKGGITDGSKILEYLDDTKKTKVKAILDRDKAAKEKIASGGNLVYNLTSTNVLIFDDDGDKDYASLIKTLATDMKLTDDMIKDALLKNKDFYTEKPDPKDKTKKIRELKKVAAKDKKGKPTELIKCNAVEKLKKHVEKWATEVNKGVKDNTGAASQDIKDGKEGIVVDK